MPVIHQSPRPDLWKQGQPSADRFLFSFHTVPSPPSLPGSSPPSLVIRDTQAPLPAFVSSLHWGVSCLRGACPPGTALQSARGPAPGPAARKAARGFSVWVDHLGVMPVCLVLLGEVGGERFFEKGRRYPLQYWNGNKEFYQFRVSRSHSAWLPSVCSPGVVLHCFEKSDSSPN